MALDIGGAAGGAIGLQEVLRSLAEQAYKNQALKQQQQRIGIEQQRANDDSELRRATLQSMSEDRAARQQAGLAAEGVRIGGAMAPGTDVTGQPDVIKALSAAGLRPKHTDATLGSTNLSGAVDTSGAIPRIIGLAQTANPGQGAKDVYGGSFQQQEKAAKDKERTAFLQTLSPHDQQIAQYEEVLGKNAPASFGKGAQAETEDVYQTGPNGKLVKLGTVAKGSHIANAPNAPQIQLVPVQTVDENGNPVTKFVKKGEGDSYVKPANATTSTRVASAETVNQVGSDLIRKLSDPAFIATVGPVMGRSGTLRDFIGNPPPEFSELAGQIESYALANMGVHGMRSAQGAEQIKKLLDQHHTPESLAATIRGLNDFSTRFVQNNKPHAGGTSAAPAGKGADPLGIR